MLKRTKAAFAESNTVRYGEHKLLERITVNPKTFGGSKGACPIRAVGCCGPIVRKRTAGLVDAMGEAAWADLLGGTDLWLTT